MEVEPPPSSQMADTNSRLLPVVVPVLLISVGFIDPGKWAASIDAGTRFGFDFMLPMILFGFASILCQYLSARIGVVTGKDLTQICLTEYDRIACLILGVQAEVSALGLDLTLVMGIAHCQSHILGLYLVTSLFFTALEAAAFPFLSDLLEKHSGKFTSIYIAFIVCVCYCIGLLIRQPCTSLSLNWMAMRLSGESVFSLMSLLGACIVPYNFYLHSALVQQHRGTQNIPKSMLSHDHFSAVVCIFSCIFLVNLALMNSAANVFYTTGIVHSNFHDSLSTMDQVYRSPIAQFALLIILFIANHINTSSWSIGGQSVVQNSFGVQNPSLHRTAVRVSMIILAIVCVWNSGVEGLYQLLIWVHVMIALMVPSLLIPLFRVASSGHIMGGCKISPLLEFFSLSTFVGVLGTNGIFMVEMLFGSSDWVNSLKENVGTNTLMPFLVLLTTSIVSLAFMLWLAATPLKSASVGLDPLPLNWERRKLASPILNNEDSFYSVARHQTDGSEHGKDMLTAQGKSFDNQSARFDLMLGYLRV